MVVADLRPFLDRARAELRTAPVNTDRPTAYQRAFLEAAQAASLPLVDPDDPATSVGVGPFPANVVDGQALERGVRLPRSGPGSPQPVALGETLVDRVVFDGTRATGVVTADGTALEAEHVLLAAGAYFSPAILLRSGVGPKPTCADSESTWWRRSPSVSACSTIAGPTSLRRLHGAAVGHRGRGCGARNLRGARGREGRERDLRAWQLGPPSRAVDLAPRTAGSAPTSSCST